MKFNFEKYTDYDFYHGRMGRGAVVVAIKKTPEGERQSGYTDLHVAHLFCSREQKLGPDGGGGVKLDPIESIKEEDGLVEIAVRFSRGHPHPLSRDSVKAVIKRVLPCAQVTFEIVESNDSGQRPRKSAPKRPRAPVSGAKRLQIA